MAETLTAKPKLMLIFFGEWVKYNIHFEGGSETGYGIFGPDKVQSAICEEAECDSIAMRPKQVENITDPKKIDEMYQEYLDGVVKDIEEDKKIDKYPEHIRKLIPRMNNEKRKKAYPIKFVKTTTYGYYSWGMWEYSDLDSLHYYEKAILNAIDKGCANVKQHITNYNRALDNAKSRMKKKYDESQEKKE